MRKFGSILVFAFVVLLQGSARALSAPEQTQLLPIEDFLATVGPVTLGWFDPTNSDWLIVDAYGKRAPFIGVDVGTTVSGDVTVRDLGDGTERVTVNLHTRDAFCWGVNNATGMTFGYTIKEVKSGIGRPALGDLHLRQVFTQPVGPLNQNKTLESSMVALMCDGELRSGSGYPEGTLGFAHTTQVGLFDTGVPAGCPPETDANCYPTEKVWLTPKGR